MSNLSKRITSAVALAAVCFAALTYSLNTRWLLLSVIIALGGWEMSRMINIKLNPNPVSALNLGIPILTFILLLPLSPFFSDLNPGTISGLNRFVIATAVCLYTFTGFRMLSINEMSLWIFLQLFSLAVSAFWCGQIFMLFGSATGIKSIAVVLVVIICMTCADTGAYFTGRALGRHKLCPSISPNKTVEGLAGGTFLTVLAAAVLAPLLIEIGIAAAVGLGLLMSVTSVTGDLLVSAFKRYTGVKDSSNLLPGHGGILDRFDSLFFSIPFAVLYFDLAGII